MDLFFAESKICLIILDSFSKLGQAYNIKSKNALDAYEALLTFISHFGIPNKIITDSGKEFDNIFKEFCNLIQKFKFQLHPVKYDTLC